MIGVVTGEDVSLDYSAYTATYDNENAGFAKPVTVNGLVLAGADIDNYNLIVPTDLTGNINAKELTVAGAIAQDKIYDGNTTAVVDFTGATLVGVITGDIVTLDTSAYLADFDTPLAGNDKDVTVTGLSIIEGLEATSLDSLELSNITTGNYSLAQPLMLKADILPQKFNVSFEGGGFEGQIVIDGDKIVKPADPVKDGYTFGGWFKDAGLTQPWDFDKDTVTADTTLYPKWVANAVVTIMPKTGQYAYLIVAGAILATGTTIVLINKKRQNKEQ